MMANRLIVQFFIFLLFFSVPLYSQQFGANPPSIRWKQVKTEAVRIIFPATWHGNVNRLAAMAKPLNDREGHLGGVSRPFDIVLQHQTTISNAYVGIGPRRSEFYLTPLQNSFQLGSLPWAEQLMLHEYRHIHQFNNFNKGVSRLFYFLAGEMGLSLANNAAIPNWFWEGDAVYQETRESQQGRGRLPYFFNGYRSLWLEQRRYSWMKLRNGSLRDYVPDHYQLGYLLTAFGNEKWGESFWRSVTSDAVRYQGFFYPFQRAVRKYSGLRYPAFVAQAMAHAVSAMDTTVNVYAKEGRPPRHFVGDQEFPHFIDSGKVLLLSSSYKKLPSFVVKELVSGRERRLRVRDISLDSYFSYRNGKAVYAAISFDPRWGWRNFSDLRVLDIATGRQQRITHRTKYFSPDISSDGQEIVAVWMAESGASQLHIVSAVDGHLIHQFATPEQWVYTYPKFMGDKYIVVAARNPKGEMGLLRLARETSLADTIIPFSMHVIGFPQVVGDTICATVSMGESDQLFMTNPSGLFQLLPSGQSRLTGHYQPHWRGDHLAWIHFSSSGWRMNTGRWSNSQLRPETGDYFKSPLPDFGYTRIRVQDPLLSQIDSVQFQSDKFPKTKRLLNVHSWLPSLSDPDYSVSFLTENILNTLQGDASFTFNRNEQSKRIGFSGTYGALFPWIRAGAYYTKDRSVRRNGQRVNWDEWELRGGLLVPLNFSGGRTYVNVRAATDYVYTKPQFQAAFKDSFSSRGYGYLDHQFFFSYQIQQARQHIFPRLAYTLRAAYAHAVHGVDARQFLASSNWYLPGFHRNHHVVLQAAWQQRDTLRQLYFSNNFPFSRGYNRLSFHQMFRWGVNYHFPVAYPDWGVAGIVYFLRIRANTFFDQTRVWDYNRNAQLFSRSFRSWGGEIYFDTNWWNQQPIQFGFRYSRLLDLQNTGLGRHQWEFILPVNLIPR